MSNGLALAGVPPKRLTVIHNPAAGRRRSGLLAQAATALRALGCVVTIRETAKRGDATVLAQALVPGTTDAVIAAGGDGVINEVAQGILGRGLTLGILPMGTANVLAAELGLPSDNPQRLAAIIAAGRTLLCRPGLIEGRVFLMMAGVGFDARVVDGVSPRLKRCLGKGAYVWSAAQELLRSPPQRYRLTVAGRVFSAAAVVIGNGRFYGGRYVCTPDARLHQPRFQLCLFERGGRWATLRYGLGLLRGTLPTMAGVTLLETDALQIDGPTGNPAQADGDIVARLPLTVRIAADALPLLVPV